ncbi:MAG: ATP-binding cassette domain-containing protein [Cytophagaceae bacterium]|jgi:ABC-type multidrug transport system ATPase subunit|nr:ATP-binding cassette domain-containing protein [Cytophagaceae bacterium]
MSETILKALMQLFALVSSTDRNDEVRREVVRNYLSQHLNNKLVGDYLNLYDSYQQEQESKLKEKKRIEKRFAASSVKILKIATAINEELTHYQKLIVTIELLEFLNSGATGILDMELDFVNTLAVTFNIPQDEYLSIFSFITDSSENEELNNKNVFIITGNASKKYHPHHIYKEHLRDELYMLNILSVNLLLIKSLKGSDLTLNGQMFQPNRVYFLRPGNSIRDSRIAPITYTDISSHFIKNRDRHKVIFEAKNISFRYPKGSAGLQPMSFFSESGNMVGIMGDSGAGKSTLINLLTGSLKPQKGEVLINGIDIHKEPAKLKGLIGYVAQDDLLIEELTVYQNLFFNAQLCFDHLSLPNIKRKVDNLLISLGLYDIRDLKVGNPLEKVISGGQRKRLNIALELIREPAVIFLDEPTSGLSSKDSENIIDLLKELSLKGKLVFVVIHQPSSEIFKMFNQLLVLDAGGYLIYNGEPVESINFFKECVNHVDRDETECPVCGNVSPEQILTIVNSNVLDEYGNPTQTRKVTAEEWHNAFNTKGRPKQLHENTALALPRINFTIPNRFKQFYIFMKRDVLAKFANRQYLLINLLESPLLALVLASLIFFFEVKPNGGGYIFYKNPNLTVYNIIAIIIAIFIGLSVSAEEIINDRKILRRESFLNLSRLSYLFSKVIILAVLSLIQTGLFVLIGNSIIQIKGMALAYWGILFTSSVFANLLGLVISDTMKKTVNIYILIPFLIIPQLILSGVFVSYDQLNPRLSSPKTIPWYGEVITARWAFEAVTVDYFKNNGYQENFFVFDKLKSQSTYYKDYWLPEMRNSLKHYTKSDDANEKERILQLLKNEIDKHNALNRQGLLFETELLSPDSFSDTVSDGLEKFFEQIRIYYVGLYSKADEKMEAVKKEMISAYGDEWLTELRNRHHNEGLERFVRRSNDIFSGKIIQYKDELVQKFDPIYEEPAGKLLKAQFMASDKRLGNNSFDTFYVNLVVMWLMNVLMFLILYFGLLTKIMKPVAFFIKLRK